jgi:hypothetical protein
VLCWKPEPKAKRSEAKQPNERMNQQKRKATMMIEKNEEALLAQYYRYKK